MVVILDTNTIIQHPMMDNELYEVLGNYLSKTDSYLLMPEIVYQELPVIYKRRLNETLNKINSAESNLIALISKKDYKKTELDIEQETENFLKRVDKYCERFKKEYSAPIKDFMFKEALHRAVYTIRPCSEGREEFRDTLLWLTVIDVAQKQDERNVVFISNNTKDFCDAYGNLHEELLKDADDKDIKIHFYKTLSDFIKDHAETIGGIDNDRVEQIIGQVKYESEILKSIEKSYYRTVEKFLERKYGWIGYISFLDINCYTDSFYIYEINDGSYLLIVILMAAVNIEVEIEPNDFDDDKWNYIKTTIVAGVMYFDVELEVTLNENFDVYDWHSEIIDIGGFDEEELYR